MTGLDSLRVGVVTGERKPELTAGARELVAALRERGATAVPVVWTDDENWADLDVAVLRSCWDYHEQVDAFRAWLETLECADVTLLNPPSVVRWNVHKFYLRELADAGVPVLDTAYVATASDTSLRGVLDARGWTDAVVKPAVGTSSANTWRTSRATAPADQPRFETMVDAGDVLVQRFALEIEAGEPSFVFLGGEFSHAWLGLPAEDDFRAHPSFGGTTTAFDPDEHLVEQAAAVLQTAHEVLDVDAAALPYARVDGVVRDDELRLLELELVEPHLGLGYGEDAVPRFADAIEAASGVT
ncbi:ATP-grasp domain-containing protein [Halobacterium wangiae]|uniref:ATP-grasp domain-containing protein n=1 Tax=Halobacterium wangiae TaxID=2902623 RepID=UPI001E30DDE1|nr:hypothetical protein [Halobacterium wangiae]